GAGWFLDPDGGPDRRVCCRGVRDCVALRHRRTVHVYVDGRRPSSDPGATGLGTTVRFIPRPVVVGFTNGIAVVIASTQIKDFFGLKIEKVPGEFLGRIQVLARNFRSLSLTETTLACVALLIIIVCLRFMKRVPGYIVALVVGTLAVRLLHLPVETIGTRFGGIPSGLPVLHIPRFRVDLIRPLISPAITVAM